MSARSAPGTPHAIVARGLALLIVLLSTATAYLLVRGIHIETGERYGPRGIGLFWGLLIGGFGYMLATRRPHNSVGWLLLTAAFIMALQGTTEEYATLALFEEGSLPGGIYVGWVANWLWIVMVGLLAVGCVLRYPTGRVLSPAWRRFEIASLIGLTVSATIMALTPGPLENFTDEFNNPFGYATWASSEIEGLVLAPMMLAMVGACWSAILRYKRSTGVERMQMKWFVAAAAGAVINLIGGASLTMLAPGVTDIWEAFTLIGFLLIPSAMAIAIMRYRLYDIDVVINKTLVYLALSALLAFVYLGGVALLQSVIPLRDDNEVAVAASTLAVAGLFQPLRRRIQGFIDHYFYRRKYDAQKTIDEFSSRLRDEIDLSALNTELVGVVTQTMQPSHVSLWLFPGSER